MSIIIRKATLADLPAIIDIYNSSIPHRNATADLEPITVESRRNWLMERDFHTRPIWVACNGEEVIGWLSLSSYKDREGYKHTVEIGIYINELFQRSGVGSSLLEHALTEAPKAGIRNIIAVIFGHNSKSISFFKRYGFELWGFLPKVTLMDGVERDVVIYGKRLV